MGIFSTKIDDFGGAIILTDNMKVGRPSMHRAINDKIKLFISNARFNIFPRLQHLDRD